jgi:phosphate transport system substrate-binding protein
MENIMLSAWKKRSVCTLLVTSWLGMACVSADAADRPAQKVAPASEKLLITGSSTIAPVMVEVVQRFRARHPGTQIEVQQGGSGRGVSDVVQGKAQIGMVSRPLAKEESSLFSFAIARDGIGLIVHKDNPVRSLSNSQVADLFAGKITNWSKVGGREAPVTVVNPKEGYGSVELFLHFFNIKHTDIKGQLAVGENHERNKAVSENRDAISYVSIGSALREANVGAPIKLLPVDGVAATPKSIRSGNYPITRPLLLVTREVPGGLIKEFIQFALSSQVTDIVMRHDFVPYLD